MLRPAAHVPHILEGEVRGTDGSVAWGMTRPGLQTVDLWVQDQDRRNMGRLQLDAAGCAALLTLVAELAQRLAGCIPPESRQPGPFS